MKVSNILLSIVATFTLGIVIGIRAHQPGVVVVQTGTAVPVASDGSGYVVEYPQNPTKSQTQILGMAYEIAKNDGLEHPQILQGIVLQETNAGQAPRYKVIGQEFGLKPNSRFYGISQLKLSAAWDVLHRWPGLKKEFNFNTFTDEEIIAKLIDDDRFNLSIASKYLVILRDRGYVTMKQMATAYNAGPGAAHHLDPDTNEYSAGVMSKLNTLAEIIK